MLKFYENRREKIPTIKAEIRRETRGKKRIKITEAGALAEMIVGGAIGLLGGPAGVILGGIIGALIGNQIEYEQEKERRKKLRK